MSILVSLSLLIIPYLSFVYIFVVVVGAVDMWIDRLGGVFSPTGREGLVSEGIGWVAEQVNYPQPKTG